MRILVIGSGAREDALSWRLAHSQSCDEIFAAPGNAGTMSRGENWNVAASDGKAIAARAIRDSIDLAVIGPETAIAAGVADQLREAGISTFGPSRSAGRLESSKIFAKRFMERHGIPTARFVAVHSAEAARKALEDWEGGCVVKADGLAAGKGVVVTPDATAARALIDDWYSHKRIPGGGMDLLLEEKLEGRELSVFAISDGTRAIPFASACDYKRAEEDDRGPNTGGMGAFSPVVHFPDDFEEQVRAKIVEPAVRGLHEEGEQYNGVLYCGLMWTEDGPCVLEFNARFGDPETQALVPRLDGDFAALLKSAADGKIEANATTFSPQACVAVVLTSDGYPERSTPIDNLPADISLGEDVQIFWSGSTRSKRTITSQGGRVLTVAALGSNIENARGRAYDSVHELCARLHRDGQLHYRTDIAAL